MGEKPISYGIAAGIHFEAGMTRRGCWLGRSGDIREPASFPNIASIFSTSLRFFSRFSASWSKGRPGDSGR